MMSFFTFTESRLFASFGKCDRLDVVGYPADRKMHFLAWFRVSHCTSKSTHRSLY